MDRRIALTVAFAASVGTIACGDKSTDTTAPSYAGGRPQGFVCSFNTMKNDVNSYFAVAARPAVQDFVTLMKGSYGPNATSTGYGFDILRKIAGAHRLMNATDGTQPVGTPADGSKLANDVIACMGTISPMPTAITDFAEALGTQGAFDVRGDASIDDAASVFTLDHSSVIKPPVAGFASWTSANELLFYAAPLPNTFVTETKVGATGFSWNTIPERHAFAGYATFGVCVYSGVSKDRVQEVSAGVSRILVPTTETGLNCQASLGMAPAGMFGRIVDLARRLVLPANAYAGTSGGGTGGLLGGLSNLGVGTIAAVNLQFGPIKDGFTTTDLDPFTVTATTAGGSKYPDMTVVLTVVGNSGSFNVYQGGVLNMHPTAIANKDGVATFSDVKIDKAGGYTLGASASDADYSALQNSKMFHIKQ
ncbi:MAG: hypothetical protein H0U85_03265 [Gemmatimonadales bacterium]|nr:hypothetical protein [Gemmatimonadales bacterium]